MNPSQLEKLRQKAGKMRHEAQNRATRGERIPAMEMLVEATSIERVLHDHGIALLPAPLPIPQTPEEYKRSHCNDYLFHIKADRGGGESKKRKPMPDPQMLFNLE